jgi:hypothetical protein
MWIETLCYVATLGYILPLESTMCACLCKQLREKFNNKDYWFQILQFEKLTECGRLFGPLASEKPWLFIKELASFNFKVLPDDSHMHGYQTRARIEVCQFVLSMFWPADFNQLISFEMKKGTRISIRLTCCYGSSEIFGSHLHVQYADGKLCWKDRDVYSLIAAILRQDLLSDRRLRPPPSFCQLCTDYPGKVRIFRYRS